MKRHPKLTLLLLLLIVAVVVTVTATLQVKKQDVRPSPALEKAEKDFYTVADYSASEPSDPQKRAMQGVQARRYNMHADKGVDPKRFAITEERQSTFSLPASHARTEPALPVSESDAVVVADVTSARAFLTEDKTNVISEFTISVTERLKESLIAPFLVGDSLQAVRSGGGIRFGSGKIIRYGSEGKPLPRLGTRYVFFLKYNNDEGKDYSIITAYALENDRVVPLDGIALDGEPIRVYGGYQRYKNKLAGEFINEVREAVTTNSTKGALK